MYVEHGSRLPSWCSFILGGVLTYLLVYIGIARPASVELSLVRRQMSTLEQSVWEIAGYQGTASEGSELISVLAEQRTQLEEAKNTLSAIRQLNRQIAEEARQVSVANSALTELAELKQSLIEQSENALLAADVVATSEMVCQRLAAVADTSHQALQVGDDLLALHDGILNQAEYAQQAEDTLSRLIGIRESIDRQTPQLDQAHQSVDALVSLKDKVLMESCDLAEAIETLELTSDLSKQFHDAALSFGRMRNWMIEIVASESLLERAQTTFEALTGSSSLHDLAPGQLRAIAAAITRKGGKLQVASKPATVSDTQEVFEDIDAVLTD